MEAGGLLEDAAGSQVPRLRIKIDLGKIRGGGKGIYQYGVEIGWLGKLSGKLWEVPWELFGLLRQLPGQSGARAGVKRNIDF